MFYCAETTQLEGPYCKKRGPLIEKHYVTPLYQVNKFSKILKIFNTLFFHSNVKQETKTVTRTPMGPRTTLSHH